MRIELFDFQETALAKLRQRLAAARQVASPDNPQVISFASPTGSGKTVMMTALLENVLFGHEDLPEQPDAVILWLSDMPALNEQSRLKIEALSDRMRARQLVTIGSTFDKPALDGGTVYFLNSQKLGTDKRLTREGSDERQTSIWKTLTNTVKAFPGRFYVVIDEAHRGMRAAADEERAQSIIQRFLLGSPEHGLVKMPIVIGLSATPQRFEELLSGLDHGVQKVYVSSEEVRRSGLIKDRTILDHPDRPGQNEYSLLQAAAAKWRQVGAAWDAYCAAEKESPVNPVLVVQVDDKDKTDLRDVLSAIEKGAGRDLRADEVVHAFHEQGDLEVEGRRVRKVEPPRIHEDPSIGVVLFKMALTTGWDCPRAEVMMSFRPGSDHTYIAQLLGRMVRTPLARRIERDSTLNDVHLFLPHFDDDAIAKVVRDLNDHETAPPTESGSARELVTIHRRKDAEEAFAAMADLVTYRVNAVRRQTSLKRLHGLARALTFDKIDPDALEATRATILSWLEERIAHAKADAAAYDARKRSVRQVGVASKVLAQGAGSATPGTSYTVETAETDLDVQFKQAGRRLGNGLHEEYWQAHASDDEAEVKTDVILLANDDDALKAIYEKADKAFDGLYAKHARAIQLQKAQRRQAYERLYLAAEAPKPLRWLDHLGADVPFRRTAAAPAYEKHLFLETDGQFKANLGTWEASVLVEEMARPDFLFWLRNVDRQPWALEIPYRVGGDFRPMFPDLFVVRKDEGGYVFDILEPHDPSLDDNRDKAVGLADFAQAHGKLYGRIQLIRKMKAPSGQQKFFRLDVNDPKVRRLVQGCTTPADLDAVFEKEAKTDT